MGSSPVAATSTAVIRCDAAPQLGFGHLVRSLALANALRDRGIHVVFAIVQGPEALRMVQTRGFRAVSPPSMVGSWSEDAWFEDVLRREQPHAVVLDVRGGLSVDTVSRVHQRGVLVVDVDDPSDRRLAADLAFYPPVPQVRAMDWTRFEGTLHAGWEWIILRPEFARHRRAERAAPASQARVLVTMGGSDPFGLTLKAVAALELVTGGSETEIVVGPGFMHSDALSAAVARSRRAYVVTRDPSDVAAVMERADLALGSFGVTAYELAAVGVPAIYLSISPDHAESARALTDISAAVSLGVHDGVEVAKFAAAIQHLLDDPAKRLDMQRRAQGAMDGMGTERVADAIRSAMARRGPTAGVSRVTH